MPTSNVSQQRAVPVVTLIMGGGQMASAALLSVLAVALAAGPEPQPTFTPPHPLSQNGDSFGAVLPVGNACANEGRWEYLSTTTVPDADATIRVSAEVSASTQPASDKPPTKPYARTRVSVSSSCSPPLDMI